MCCLLDFSFTLWVLLLNGFFLLTDFLTKQHKTEKGSDIDKNALFCGKIEMIDAI